MKARLALLALVALTLLPASLYADAAKGADVYKAKCQMCHGADGKGQTPMGKSMKLKDLGSADVQNMKDSELKTLIENGKGKMPSYKGKLTNAEIEDVVQHIRTFKGK
jgi:cytochrome c6